ncbi:bifunctional methylenetetrahydrofolate dehydrogenase/methenyltetrahydrofolate cyclohydrolase FolD [Bacteroidota bacterium]
MILIDGRKISAEIKAELKQKVEKYKNTYNMVPGLVTILIGENPASKVYVNMKNKACKEIGVFSIMEHYDESISEEKLLNVISEYNNDERIHGILVQLPLPNHINESKVIESVDPRKDVDGFHPISIGKLVLGKETFYSCTPYGIMELIKRYNIKTKGKNVVIVGRSNIVGKPLANMLMQKKENANAIVTVCHSAAEDISYYTKKADILIAAIGSPEFIKEEMVRDDAVVIDVGINRIEDPDSPKGYRIVGDVDFQNVSKKVSYITPVPGGVGPMTIAMLINNTCLAFEKIRSNS